MTEPVCHCGHVLDEHDEYRMCTVVGCDCIHYERDRDAAEALLMLHEAAEEALLHEASKSRLKWLWDLAERMDWSDRWPRPFWKWLLRKCDELNGHHGLDYDY